MADLFVTLVSIVPKPSTVTVGGTNADGAANTSGSFTGTGLKNTQQQVTTPGVPPGK